MYCTIFGIQLKMFCLHLAFEIQGIFIMKYGMQNSICISNAND